MKKILFVFIALCVLSGAHAQERRLQYWEDPDAFISEQTRLTLDAVDKVLAENPPVVGLIPVRELAFFNIDAILHDTRNDDSPVIAEYMAARIRRVIDALKEPAGEGMMIYKLYNHSFVVRTRSATVAFDLYRGGGLIPVDMMKEITGYCDIMFVSHAHGDHADKVTADMFTSAGKYVVAPKGLWENTGPYIKNIRSEEIIKEKFLLPNGKKLDVTILPGHQGEDVINNIYVVEMPEGFTVAQTGDQSSQNDVKWFPDIKKRVKTDVLLVNCWAHPLELLIEGIDPKLIIPGHENELGHSIDHREPYWLTPVRFEDITKPIVYMTWGEVYRYNR